MLREEQWNELVQMQQEQIWLLSKLLEEPSYWKSKGNKLLRSSLDWLF